MSLYIKQDKARYKEAKARFKEAKQDLKKLNQDLNRALNCFAAVSLNKKFLKAVKLFRDKTFKVVLYAQQGYYQSVHIH